MPNGNIARKAFGDRGTSCRSDFEHRHHGALCTVIDPNRVHYAPAFEWERTLIDRREQQASKQLLEEASVSGGIAFAVRHSGLCRTRSVSQVISSGGTTYIAAVVTEREYRRTSRQKRPIEF
jgi:hypothetical protein